jgi:hypothetical protein
MQLMSMEPTTTAASSAKWLVASLDCCFAQPIIVNMCLMTRQKYVVQAATTTGFLFEQSSGQSLRTGHR